MCRFNKILFLLLGLLLTQAWSTEYVLRPISDTFVVKPGTGNSLHVNAAQYNYGGAGSRSVSSPEAYAYQKVNGVVSINHQPKGEFISLLRYDFSELAGRTINSITLQLYTSNGNQSAAGIFNYIGSAGYFDLSLMTSNWQQGTGAPHEITTYPYNSLNGINYNSLQELLKAYPPRMLDRFYYDAHNSYGSPVWCDYTFNFSNGRYTELRTLIASGDTVTFMLSPTKNSKVCFNFSAYTQLWPDAMNILENGPKLEVETEARSAQISNCYADTMIEGINFVGGLAGYDCGGIENCYFNGDIKGDFSDPNYLAGPIVAIAKVSTINSYWNTSSVSLIERNYPDGLTNAAMFKSSSFTGFGFINESNPAQWKTLREDQDYPRLIWQYEYPGDIAGLYGVDNTDLNMLLENWLVSSGGNSVVDIDKDGITDIRDFALLAGDWLKGL